ncbi:heterokaryon incompatibility protein-domain-containing protein [Ilyonectria robusta]|uniref:heterokaryon incompatibility protein-domain-containing protein n=1 Tax=Ilyonectria robusta TaxID=1079257 RepID=UPI001E8D2E4B|nr:heterokaryon incompatibility protein-domain-containing protein [Ilyonectria robusta]KAH8669329.1 heterokaryon incompatibility protein-domain-containing protein [Ilyonectria robusta]
MLQAPPDKDIFTTPENGSFFRRRKYNRLSPEDHEIRLLRMHPVRLTLGELAAVFPKWLERDTDAADLSLDKTSRDSSTFICCQLVEANKLELQERKYAALSYCAGKPTETRRIMIDGYWFNAFANLEHALEGFREHYDRSSSSGNLIWADQVCINQLDFQEKSHQVSFMRKIYENAEKTYVVLSTPRAPIPDAEAGVLALRLALNHLEARLQEESPCYSVTGFRTGYSEIFLDWVYEHPNHPVCGALAQLLNFVDRVCDAKWWTRAWVFQEFLVSDNIHFVCGSQCLELNDLAPFLRFRNWNTTNEESVARFELRSKSPHSERIAHSVELLKKSAMHCRQSETSYKLPMLFDERRKNRYILHFPSTPEFLHLLATASSFGFQATDPRDMLYAFTGLSSITSGVTVDYSPTNTIWDVCAAIAEKFIEHGDLSLLRLATTTRGVNAFFDENLPSWAPDWKLPASWIPCQHSPWKIPSAERHRFAGKALCVQGVHLATLGDETHNGIFQAMGHYFDTTSLVQSGDELWAIHEGTGIHTLRKREGGGYVLVGLAILLPGRVSRCYGGCTVIEVGPLGLSEYTVVMDAIEASLAGVQSIVLE